MLGYDGLPTDGQEPCDPKFFRIKRTDYYGWVRDEDGIERPKYYLTTDEALQYLKCSRMSLWRNVKPIGDDDNAPQAGRGFKYPRLYSDKSLVVYKQKLDAQKAQQSSTKQTELKVM